MPASHIGPARHPRWLRMRSTLDRRSASSGRRCRPRSSRRSTGSWRRRASVTCGRNGADRGDAQAPNEVGPSRASRRSASSDAVPQHASPPGRGTRRRRRSRRSSGMAGPPRSSCPRCARTATASGGRPGTPASGASRSGSAQRSRRRVRGLAPRRDGGAEQGRRQSSIGTATKQRQRSLTGHAVEARVDDRQQLVQRRMTGTPSGTAARSVRRDR